MRLLDRDEASLEPAEFDRRLRLALADEEDNEQIRALIEWFLHRYPTPRDRLAYIRRKYAEWMREPVSVTPVEEPTRADAK